MFKNVNKKMVVFGITILFLSLIVAPSINANVSDNVILSKVVDDDDDETDYDLLIICPKKFKRSLKTILQLGHLRFFIAYMSSERA